MSEIMAADACLVCSGVVTITDGSATCGDCGRGWREDFYRAMAAGDYATAEKLHETALRTEIDNEREETANDDGDEA